MKSSLVVLASALLLAPACGSDPKLPPLFEPQPECEGAPVVPYAGDSQNVLSTIEIGKSTDGLDLDGESDLDCGPNDHPCALPDNQLAAVGSLAGSAIRDAVAAYDILIPVEFFDLPAVTNDSCVKFALYLGIYKHDADTDGKDTAVANGDCDDTSITRAPGLAESETPNLIDDDCDGFADGSPSAPSANDVDNDLDGYSPMMGDCDDTTETGPASSPGLTETCGDGIDNDCDGVADRGADPNPCDPYTTTQTIDIDPQSFDDHGDPLIAFTNGTITDGVLTAGPSIFTVKVPTGLNGLVLDLRITGAQIVANISNDGDSVKIDSGQLGGVLDAQTMDNIRGLTVTQINLTPENSLLDATFANILGTILGLKHSKVPAYTHCMQPDIDVDRDGLETFCDSIPNDDTKTVDMCIDGDGTVIMDTAEAQCTAALDKDGNPRFTDGVSVELNFTTNPAILRAQP